MHHGGRGGSRMLHLAPPYPWPYSKQTEKEPTRTASKAPGDASVQSVPGRWRTRADEAKQSWRRGEDLMNIEWSETRRDGARRSKTVCKSGAFRLALANATPAASFRTNLA